MSVPRTRIRVAREGEGASDARFVLYVMTAARRARFNFALERAVELANEHRLPLVVLEPLRCRFRWASDRVLRFALDGMLDNGEDIDRAGVTYVPLVEEDEETFVRALRALCRFARAIVVDDHPTLNRARWLSRLAQPDGVRVEAVDGNGLYPVREADRTFSTAASFRRHLQKGLREHLEAFPAADPLAALRAKRTAKRPRGARGTPAAALASDASLLHSLPIDHDVAPVALRGGSRAARRALERFVDRRLARYGERRNEPSVEGTSGFSPYLHYGHLSVHEVFRELAVAEGWSLDLLAEEATGRREGWWGMGANAEAFLDELVTWREIGFNFCTRHRDYDRYPTLPAWARETLEAHAADPRPSLYTKRQLERAETHDRVWNAAQRQLLVEGRIAGYLRMLWGKKILEWSPSPRTALGRMLALNERWAIDGRDPNSVSGIFWVLGRYDRAWGPERSIYGKIRYMTSPSAERKLDLAPYLERWAPNGQGSLALDSG